MSGAFEIRGHGLRSAFAPGNVKRVIVIGSVVFLGFIVSRLVLYMSGFEPIFFNFEFTQRMLRHLLSLVVIPTAVVSAWDFGKNKNIQTAIKNAGTTAMLGVLSLILINYLWGSIVWF